MCPERYLTLHSNRGPLSGMGNGLRGVKEKKGLWSSSHNPLIFMVPEVGIEPTLP
jgi:hypothetical protein